MPDHSLHAEGDPAARVEAARSEMIASATEAWEAIRAMEPSAERVHLERSFAEQARASMKLAPTMKRVASSMVRARIWSFSPGHHWCGELSCWRRSP